MECQLLAPTVPKPPGCAFEGISHRDGSVRADLILGAAACHEILTRNGEVNDNVEHLEAVLTVLARYVTQPMAS
jgi:hypothetical protein